MIRAELMKFVGKNVRILFRDGEWAWGNLEYSDKFSAFHIGNISFHVSAVGKIVESIEADEEDEDTE